MSSIVFGPVKRRRNDMAPTSSLPCFSVRVLSDTMVAAERFRISNGMGGLLVVGGWCWKRSGFLGLGGALAVRAGRSRGLGLLARELVRVAARVGSLAALAG